MRRSRLGASTTRGTSLAYACSMTIFKLRDVSAGVLVAALGAGCATDPSITEENTSMTESALSNSEQSAFNFFVSKGLTKVQAAGVIGNLVQESSVNPGAVEYGGGPGRGIAQWSVGGRWDSSYHDNVTWYANAHAESRWALSTQLNFIWYELSNYGYGLASLRAASTVTQATVAFQDRFEICGTCDSTRRIQYAQQALAAYGGAGGGDNGPGCYSHTLGAEMPDNACVQSRCDGLWYQCADGAWVDRWTDPDACNGVHPL